MNREPYAIALGHALNEIKKSYPGIIHSFIFNEENSLIIEDLETDKQIINDLLNSFQKLKEIAKSVVNIKKLHIQGEKGLITFSKVDNIYLLLVSSTEIEKDQLNSIPKIIIPTILKTMEDVNSPNLELTSSKELVVDTLTGFFSGDSVQIDTAILKDWKNNSNLREDQKFQNFDHVKIETVDGNSHVCKVKEIKNPKMNENKTIRIPEKLCKNLELNKGD
ncbi:MAG: hypothetical protein JSV76_07140, partial [Candidatus Bathyarchaeota archaeon]